MLTKTVAMGDTSPVTMATAAHQTNNLANMSPVGSTGTEKFADYEESECGEEQEQDLDVNTLPKQMPEKEPETPAKTVLPEDYNATTGLTPSGFEGWQIAHLRVNCDRPNVPGHSLKRPFCLETPTRDKK